MDSDDPRAEREAACLALAFSFQKAGYRRAQSRARFLHPFLPEPERPPPHADQLRGLRKSEAAIAAALAQPLAEGCCLIRTEFRPSGRSKDRDPRHQKGSVTPGSRHSPG